MYACNPVQNTGPNSKPIFHNSAGREIIIYYSGQGKFVLMMHAGGRIFLCVTLLLSHLLCLYHDVCGNPPPTLWLLLLLPSDHVCLVLLVYWISFFYVCQQFVVAQGIQSFEIRGIAQGCCLLLATVTNTKWRLTWIRKEHKELIG